MSVMDKVMIKLDYIDHMSGDDFEEYATRLLREVGYKNVIHTPMIDDHGLDAYGYTVNGTRIGFQFKRFQGKVSYNAIYETIGGGIYYHTKINVLLTNSYFTNNTYRTCHIMNRRDPNHTILLWNRNYLRNLIYKAYLKHGKKKHSVKKRVKILKKPAIRKIINLFHKAYYQTYNTYNTSLNLIGINRFNKVGLKFIFCDSFDKQLYNKYVPLNVLMRVALRISKHSNMHVNLIISSDLLFSKTEYNYIRQNINKDSDTKVILKDYKHLIPISLSYKMKFDGIDYYYLHNLIPKKRIPTKHMSFKKVHSKRIPIIHNRSLRFIDRKKYKETKQSNTNISKINKHAKANKNYISRQFVGHNLHKQNVFYNTTLLVHFVKDIKKLFQAKGFRVIKLHQSKFDLLLINKNKNYNIGIKFIHALSQLYNIKYWEICNTINHLYNDKSNNIKEYNIKSIQIITNGTFMPKEFNRIHNKYPRVYLKDFNLLKLEKKVNNNDSIDKLLKDLNLSNKHLYRFITEKGYLNDIDYTHKSLLLMPLVYKIIRIFAFGYGVPISIPEPSGYSLDFIIHYKSSFLVGIKFMLRIPNAYSSIKLKQLVHSIINPNLRF